MPNMEQTEKMKHKNKILGETKKTMEQVKKNQWKATKAEKLKSPKIEGNQD